MDASYIAVVVLVDILDVEIISPEVEDIALVIVFDIIGFVEGLEERLARAEEPLEVGRAVFEGLAPCPV